jgi:sugar/nucleoside kinase (ribokinase family)
MTNAVTWDVVGIGENSVDEVYRVRGRLAPNAKAEIVGRRLLPGGQVATALCTCARLGLRAAYVGTFGQDAKATVVREAMARHGVDVRHAAQRPGSNRYAVILVEDETGDRTVLWHRGPALALSPGDLPPHVLTDARAVLVDNVDEEAAIAGARIARAAGAVVMTDIDAIGSRTPELVDAATFPVLAEHVPARLTGEGDAGRALRALRQRHGGMLCVTLGSRGAMLLDGDRLHHQPAFGVHAVDTTGAGDVFRGALIYALLRGDGPAAMLRFAAAAAAVSCTREGAIGGVPSVADVEALITQSAT